MNEASPLHSLVHEVGEVNVRFAKLPEYMQEYARAQGWDSLSLSQQSDEIANIEYGMSWANRAGSADVIEEEIRSEKYDKLRFNQFKGGLDLEKAKAAAVAYLEHASK
ncbi:MAG: hypothetical protein IT406_00395 [Candidatus Yanofskybacteria bacterium]|nr:hypothetical protein [Candidatus Yanofskybacteria bacterium]